MLKSLIAFVSIFFMGAGGGALDAYAAPSIKQLGTNVSIGTDKNVATLPSLPKTAPEAVRVAKTQVAEKDISDTARVSKGLIKITGPSKIVQTSSNQSWGAGGSGTSSVSGVSIAAFNEVVGRVQSLESESHNAITGVTESGSGNYVSGVSVDNNNKLNVEKTRLLYAPVRNAGSDTIVSDAEIWLVR